EVPRWKLHVVVVPEYSCLESIAGLKIHSQRIAVPVSIKELAGPQSDFSVHHPALVGNVGDCKLVKVVVADSDELTTTDLERLIESLEIRFAFEREHTAVTECEFEFSLNRSCFEQRCFLSGDVVNLDGRFHLTKPGNRLLRARSDTDIHNRLIDTDSRHKANFGIKVFAYPEMTAIEIEKIVFPGDLKVTSSILSRKILG